MHGKIPKSVNRSIPFIKILVKSKGGKVNRLDLLRKFPEHVVNDISEILRNVVLGTLPLKDSHVKALKKYKTPLMKLTNLNKRKRGKFIYKQKGGFLGAVLPIVASLIGGLVANVV
jgi:hypothetical protein